MSLTIVASGSKVEAEVGRQELLLLQAIPPLLATVSEGDDPAFERLYPTPYGEDEADHEFRRLAVPEIERARIRDNQALTTVLERLVGGKALLSRSEAEACLRAVGAGRLTVAARHGLFDQATFEDAQETAEGAIVAFLGLVQDELVGALTDLEEGAE